MSESRFRLLVVLLLTVSAAGTWLPGAVAPAHAESAPPPATCTLVRGTVGDTAGLLEKTNRSVQDLQVAGLKQFTFINLSGGWDVMLCGW